MWRGEECVLKPVYSGIGHRKIKLGFHPVDLFNFHENTMSIKKHTNQWVWKEESFLSNKFSFLAFYGHYLNWLENSISYSYFVPNRSYNFFKKCNQIASRRQSIEQCCGSGTLFVADPDQIFSIWYGSGSTFHFDADPDAEPALHHRDANLRPLVFRHTTASRPSIVPFYTSTAPEFWLRCESGSVFCVWLWCGSGSVSQNDMDPGGSECKSTTLPGRPAVFLCVYHAT